MASEARVVVIIRGGMASVYTDGEADVLTVDYDVDGVDDDMSVLDAQSRRCVVHREVENAPALVARAFSRFPIGFPTDGGR